MTTATTFMTTANISSVNPTDGRNGPQWLLKCKFPWTGGNFDDSVYLEQSQFPTEPARGIHQVEVSFRSLKNKQEGGKHSGTHYWMNNYYITRITGATNQMDASPNNQSVVPGMENTAAANSDTFSGNGASNGMIPTAPPTNGSEILGSVRGHCDNAIIALKDHLPGVVLEGGGIDWDQFVFHRDEFYNKVVAVSIQIYADDNAEPVAEEPAPAAPAAPVVQEHHCEKHSVGFNKYSNGYMHKVAGTDAYCHEGVDGIYDDQGNPVEAMV
jgi:hypothetical protein